MFQYLQLREIKEEKKETERVTDKDEERKPKERQKGFMSEKVL